MKYFFIFIFVMPIFTWGSGELVLENYRTESNGSQEKACMMVRGGHGVIDEWFCSKPVSKEDVLLERIKKLIMKFKRGTVVGRFKRNFSVQDLNNSLTRNNCDLSPSGVSKIKRLEREIKNLQKNLEEEKSNYKNYSCFEDVRSENSSNQESHR